MALSWWRDKREGPACVTLDDDDDDDDDGDDDDDDAVDDGGGGDHGGRTLLSSATFQNAAISKLESSLDVQTKIKFRFECD